MSHESEILEYTMNNFKDHVFGFRMTPKVCSAFFDKVMNDYVSTLLKLLIREKHIKGLSIRLNGMKCKYPNNHIGPRLVAMAIMHRI